MHAPHLPPREPVCFPLFHVVFFKQGSRRILLQCSQRENAFHAGDNLLSDDDVRFCECEPPRDPRYGSARFLDQHYQRLHVRLPRLSFSLLPRPGSFAVCYRNSENRNFIPSAQNAPQHNQHENYPPHASARVLRRPYRHGLGLLRAHPNFDFDR